MEFKKIDLIFKSIYAMLIFKSFYLFNILCKDLNYKEGCRNKVFSSHSMSHYHERRYHFINLTTEYYV